ncbi:MAG: ATP-dependent Clp protease ATP-binding subunit ClpX, partial [Neisseriaceae bacterium]|nr:ATP-dependent Clp protease ATP-binding subunit ClpX [Neisseriaceae bacterium]
AIAKITQQRKTGARGLRSVLEDVLLDTMYSLPDNKNIAQVIVNKAVIDKKQAPKLVYIDDDKKTA